jgi:single-stranded DNA-binding protein
MSVGMRTVTLVGWAGRDAEWREVNGQGVLNVSLGMDASWQKDGQWQNKTVWVKATRWYKNPEHAQQAASKIVKFTRLAVSGELEEPEAWIKMENGQSKAYATNRITASKIVVVGEGDARTGQPQQASAPLNELHDEDIPF